MSAYLIRQPFEPETSTNRYHLNIMKLRHSIIYASLSCIPYLLRLILLIFYSLLLIYCYHYFHLDPRINLKLSDSTFACHDTMSCEKLYNRPAVHTSSAPIIQNNYSRQVFFSALFTKDYFRGAVLLGYTLKIHHPYHPMYMMYFDSKLPDNMLQVV